MTNANTLIYDKSVDRAAMVRLYEQRTSSKVELIVDGHAIRVDKLVRESKLQGKDFASFQKALDAEIIKTMSNAHNTTSRALLDLFKSQISHTVNNLSEAVSDIWHVATPPRRVAEEVVLHKPLYQNLTLSEGWAGVGKNEKIRIEGIIRKGIAEGLPTGDIAKEITKSTFAITKNQAKGLVVTATTSVYSQADQEVYKANAKVLQGWQYVAVLDTRTTPLCAGRDGTIYPVGDTEHLPPAHWYCRSSTTPITKSYDELAKSEGIAQIRKRNLAGLTEKQIAFYDGQTPLKESYNEWLQRQPTQVQLKHLGDLKKVEAYQAGQLTVSQFTNSSGNSIGIKELNRLTTSGYGIPGDTRRFAAAKDRLDTIKLGAARPDDFYGDLELQKALKEYYMLQAGELDGTLSLTNYRGALLHTKKATKTRVLSTPPSEANLKFNPITSRYEDARMYQPSPATLENAYKNVDESILLKPKDKEFIKGFVDGLEDRMGVNERAVVTENLRITFSRFRDNKEAWANFKAVLQGQIKFDIMNVSDYMETQIRRDANLLLKLKQANYIDPVLGPVQLQSLSDGFIANIKAKNDWEDRTAPRIAKQLRNVLDYKIPVKLKRRIEDHDLEHFYLKFARRLSLADNPDRDQLAVALGRDLYNMANYRGSRNEWYNLGVKILDDANNKGFYELETFGVQKRRMKSRNFGAYFGPYYDTFAVNLRITDPRIQEYAKLTRKVDVGLRIGVTTKKNELLIREGYNTYHVDDGLLGLYDTRIEIASSEVPLGLIDKDLTDALNWAAKTKYKIDADFHDFIVKLINFQDDKGKAEYYNNLNKYREFMVERGDAYERLKSMEWLRAKDAAFSNHPFLDHRGRIYERGFISPQSGETFRPFLSTAESKNFSALGFKNLQDQIGGFLGGTSDALEGKYNSLSVLGRQQIAMQHRKDLIMLGDAMRRGKPADIRRVLDSKFLAQIDGEEQGKVLRFALEMSKIDEFLRGDYSANSLLRLKDYSTALALEQDASSSGAQIIALTTKNKQLAALSNVIPTDQKQRLYDEIAHSTFNDPRFKKLNVKLGLTEKDLRKASKAQNMVTFYGAGERTGILNVEGKLAKVLEKSDTTLVVKAVDRDKILNEISARMARYEKFDQDKYLELKALRQDVKDIFNKGLNPGDEIMDQLYFLDSQTRDVVEKLSREYERVVTPDDFQQIAKIMSEHLSTQVPILRDFTKFFGRLADDFALHAKPKASSLDYNTALRTYLLGEKHGGDRLPKWLSRILAIKDEPIRTKLLNRIPGYLPSSISAELLNGVAPPATRRTGFKIGNFSLFSEDITQGMEIGIPNKLPKQWNNIPWVNFDGKVIEQNFTQVFEERLNYKDKDGHWVTNILQVPQKTNPTWWEEFRGKSGKINAITDTNKARTAFAVNGNHSNDATLVKQFHLWGKKIDVGTSTIHDAFFTNVSDMLRARGALRGIYGDAVESESIKATLQEMLNRGLPKELYDKYLNEAIDTGLIPVVGRSRIDGKLLTEKDILTRADILRNVDENFDKNRYWYGIG